MGRYDGACFVTLVAQVPGRTRQIKLKEQTVQILNQVERNRLESRLGKGRGLEKGGTRRGVTA